MARLSEVSGVATQSGGNPVFRGVGGFDKTGSGASSSGFWKIVGADPNPCTAASRIAQP